MAQTLKAELGLMDLQEAAAYLELSAAYLVHLKYKGKGPDWIKRGNRLYYQKDALVAWHKATVLVPDR